jgi:hypothetical protein
LKQKKFTKTALRNLISELPESSPILAAMRAAAEGATLPYSEGAKPPIMAKVAVEPTIDGAPNPAYYVELRIIAVDMDLQWQHYYGHAWPAFTERLKAIDDSAKENGIDLKEYAEDVMTFREFKRINDVMSASDSMIRTQMTLIKGSHSEAEHFLDEVKKKSWIRTFERLLELREMCRSETCPFSKKPSTTETWEALHGLRYMIYLFRSTLFSKDAEPAPIMIAPHIIKMFMTIEIARKHRASDRIEGVLIQLPPGHGKTWAIIADRSMQLNKRTNEPFAFLHAVQDTAQERFNAVMSHFDDETDIGARRKALFPNVGRWKRYKGTQKLWLEVDGRKRCEEYTEGNLTFYGLMQAALGKGVIELSIDDPSKAEEAEQAGTRDATNRALANTWLPRLRGLNSFFVYVCTSWHPDDFASKLLEMARKGQVNIAYYSATAGGPESRFRPLWPEMCDSKKLKAHYARLGPGPYACQFQNNPMHESARRVSRLCFYPYNYWTDPDCRPPEWEDFFRNAMYYISGDPAGAEHKHANLAGALVAAMGVLRIYDEKLKRELDVPKIVLTNYWSGHATQSNFADSIIDLTAHLEREPDPHKIHEYLIESVSGFHATREFLEREHQIDPSRIQGGHPGFGTKVQRFVRSAAIHCENGDILFPGEPGPVDEDGNDTLKLIEEWSEVSNQIYQAGSVRETNMLDCIAFLMKHLAPLIKPRLDQIAKIRNAPAALSLPNTRKQKFYQSLIDQSRKRKLGTGHKVKNLSMLKGRRL